MNFIHHLMFLGGILAAPSAFGVTQSVDILCEKYPSAIACADKPKACTVCHAGPPSLNDFGVAVKDKAAGQELAAVLSTILVDIEKEDSDGDKVSNIDELLKGGNPGDKAIQPGELDVPVEYDLALAYKRMKSTFCGESATYADMQALSKEKLHQDLTACLDGNYWKNEALHRIADSKIQPLEVLGQSGDVVIGDYRWDYWLYSYIMTGDRDVRELLSATYHYNAETGEVIQGAVPRAEGFQLGARIVIAGGQPLAANRRAGMATTQWFISNFTMFAELPRNTAAQVYRAYLGLDLAKGEGLEPVAGEPRDVDNKNIAQPACAVCHSTLDPLAYAFSTYRGIEISAGLAFGNPIGQYQANRQPWEADGAIFGQQVNNLLEWAEVARNSDAFKKKMVSDIFHFALSRDPYAREAGEFELLWKGLPADGYSMNKMIHRFVDTKAFGGKNLK